MIQYENKPSKGIFIAGCDEVGRGCLAGPVVAACCLVNFKNRRVSLPRSWKEMGITDSKKLSPLQRKKIVQKFNWSPHQKIHLLQRDHSLESWMGIAEVSPKVIDQINIHKASLSAMKKAFDMIYDKKTRGTLLIDGPHVPPELPESVSARGIIKGDRQSILIGLASIFAKQYRDALMKQWDDVYPDYGFVRHVGYPTAFHREAVTRLGITSLHRKSFTRKYIKPNKKTQVSGKKI